MKKVCLIALLPWIMSCGWASSLFSSAPAESEEPQVTVALSDEPPADDTSALPAEEEASAPTTQSAEVPTTQPAEVPAATAAAQNPAPATTANAAAGTSVAVPPAPVTMTAPGPVTAASSDGVYSISPSGNVMAEESRSRTERRRMKVEEFAHRIDSLVLSRNFMFLPNSMQEFPGGGLQMIYNVYFYLGIYGNRVEVHLPTTRGAFLPYVEILNFDTTALTDYRCTPAQSGWNISFGIANGESRYNVNMYVTPATGEAIITLYMNSAAIRYVGYIRSGDGAS